MNGALEALYAKRPSIIKPGLRRIEAALKALGDVGQATPSALIGGTNGKGSTAGYLWRLLSGASINTGLFTSPHLVSFNERIVTSLGPTTDEELVTTLAELTARLPPEVEEPLSFFEMNTLLAFFEFKKRGTAFNVLEVGLGGRFDSTNVASPEISIITSIGLDHQQYLGTTPDRVAFEKSGIMRRGCPVIWGGQGEPTAARRIEREAERQGARLVELGREIRTERGRVRIEVAGVVEGEIQMPSEIAGAPEFLRRNFALAAAAFVWLISRGTAQATKGKDIGKRVGEALDRFERRDPPPPLGLRARFERVVIPWATTQRHLLLDVGHNPDGALALVAAIKEKGLSFPLPGVVSILSDKDMNGVLDVLREVLSPMILFPASGERAWRPEMLEPRHAGLAWAESFEAALSSPLLAAPPTGLARERPIVVCGSVHALGDVLKSIR